MKALPNAESFSASGHLEKLSRVFVRVNWREPIPMLRADDIILAHAPPAGGFTAMTTGSGTDYGDLDLADALRSSAAPPWLVLSGHIHAPRRWKDRCGRTITLNPGVNDGASVPNYISIDTTKRKAWWFKNGEMIDMAQL